MPMSCDVTSPALTRADGSAPHGSSGGSQSATGVTPPRPETDAVEMTGALSRSSRATLTHDLLCSAYRCEDPRRRHLLDKVVILNRPVAETIAAGYRDRGIAYEDLCQTALEGLVKAVHRFDPTVRENLLTYAVPTIRGELQRHFRDHGWSVRPPRRIQDLQWQINRVTAHFAQTHGHEPNAEEIAEILSVDPAEVTEALQAFGCFQPASLDRPVGADGGGTMGELLPDDEPAFAASEARVMLLPLVRRLSERDRRILHLRFVEDRTQAEIGEELGVTQMQVSRLLTRIFGDLREQIAEPALS